MVKKWCNWVFFMTAIMIFFLGLTLSYAPVFILSIFFLWLSNIFMSFERSKIAVVFNLFNFSFFVFLISRPLIDLLKGNHWYVAYGEKQLLFSVTLIYLGLLGLRLGAEFALWTEKHKDYNDLPYWEKNNGKGSMINAQRKVALLLFVVTYIFNMMMAIEKMNFVLSNDYLTYFISFKSTLPTVVQKTSGLMFPFFCLFLASMPKKRTAIVGCAAYVVSAFPSLIMGARYAIVLNIMLCFTYFVIRDYFSDEEQWIGKKEKILILVVTPIALFVLGQINYLRADTTFKDGFLSLVVDFFYKQGVSFNALKYSFEVMKDLPTRAIRNYTFGGVIDFVVHGPIGQFFGEVAIPDGNNIIAALESNSFAHNMSFLAKGAGYLSGEGWGSSYLVEAFVDYGYFGVLAVSFVLGWVFIKIVPATRKNLLLTTLIIVFISNIYFTPRASLSESLVMLISVRLWVCVIGVYILAGLFYKKYPALDINKKRRVGECLRITE